MASYLTSEEIKATIESMVSEYLTSCQKDECLSNDFIELIKYRFKAKYAFYNAEEKMIEVGIKKYGADSLYRTIEDFSFSIPEIKNKFQTLLNDKEADLSYYGKFLKGNQSDSVVVLK